MVKTSPTPSIDWEAEAKLVIKAELARAGVSYKVLVSRLQAMGVKGSTAAVASRITRGRFTFVFFLQCMHALGVDDVRVGVRRPEG